jgi:hypothetical protein
MQSTVPIVAGGAADSIAGCSYGDLAVRVVTARSAALAGGVLAGVSHRTRQ